MSEKKSLEPIIYPAFATPFAQISYPDCELLNQQLEQFFDQLTAQGDKHRNARLHNYAQDALFESNFDLFKYEFFFTTYSNIFILINNVKKNYS